MNCVSRTPHPRVLDYITPTQVVDGDECLWRLGFSCDPATSALNRSGPAAALGIAAHEIMSRLGDPLGFDTVWNEAVSSAADDLTAQWAPAVPPSPENWPGWSLTRVRMRKLWERSPASVGHKVAPPSGAPQSKHSIPPLPWRERWIRHGTLPLAGRPDLVEQVDGKVCVIDLKTGLRQSEPNLAQRTQLLLYCELVRSELGLRPTLAAVESTRGQRFTFDVDWEEVQDVVDHAVTKLECLNSGHVDGLAESLATPSAKACGLCPCRPICGPFFNIYDESWPTAHALLFEVRSVAQRVHGYEVEATVLKPRWRANEDVHIVGFPFDSRPEAGEVWGAVDFAGRANSAVAAWNTRVAKWSS